MTGLSPNAAQGLGVLDVSIIMTAGPYCTRLFGSGASDRKRSLLGRLRDEACMPLIHGRTPPTEAAQWCGSGFEERPCS